MLGRHAPTTRCSIPASQPTPLPQHRGSTMLPGCSSPRCVITAFIPRPTALPGPGWPTSPPELRSARPPARRNPPRIITRVPSTARKSRSCQDATSCTPGSFPFLQRIALLMEAFGKASTAVRHGSRSPTLGSRTAATSTVAACNRVLTTWNCWRFRIVPTAPRPAPIIQPTFMPEQSIFINALFQIQLAQDHRHGHVIGHDSRCRPERTTDSRRKLESGVR